MNLLLSLIVKPILLGIYYAIMFSTMITGIYLFTKHVLKIDLFKETKTK